MGNELNQGQARRFAALGAEAMHAANPYLCARGAPIEIYELCAIRRSAERAHDCHRQIVEEAERRIEGARTKIEADAGDRPLDTGEGAKVRQRIQKVRAAIVAQSAGPRAKLIEKIERAARRVAPVEPIYSDPVGHLMTVTVDGEAGRDRERYDSMLRHAAPLELHNLSLRAAATRDKALAASVLSAHRAMSRSDRSAASIDPAALAESVLGSQYRAAALALQIVANRVFMVRSRDAEFTSGRADPMARLERGLRQHLEQNRRSGAARSARRRA